MRALRKPRRPAALLLGSLLLLAGGPGCATTPGTRGAPEEKPKEIKLVAARVYQAETADQQSAPTTPGPDHISGASAEENSNPPLVAAPMDPPAEKRVESPAAPPAASPPTAYRLRPGNPVRIDLLGIPDARVINDVIDETGLINLMYIGEIKAAGKTAHELERDIEKEYINQKIYKQISVNVVVQAKQYFVRGEVQRPGSFPLTAGATLAQAIAVSGGFSEFANLKKIRISRGGETITVNFKDIEKDSRKDIALEVGDTIVVTRSVF